MEKVLYNHLFRQRQTARLDIRSKAFVFNARISETLHGRRRGTFLRRSNGTVCPRILASLALIVEGRRFADAASLGARDRIRSR